MATIIGTSGAGRTYGRNEDCPCGSGLKAKRCHMLAVPPDGVPVIIGGRTRLPYPSWMSWIPGDASPPMCVFDAGAGDAIHAMRFVPHLAALGATFIVRRDMLRLFRASFPDAPVTAHYPLPPAAVVTDSIELIRLNPDGAARAPYLHASPIARDRRFHVGLCLRGDPTQAWDRWRSISDVRPLEPLIYTPGVTWVNLERGGPDLPAGADWADTANLVAGLDAVVSVDTGVAHLAGALGVPLVLLDRAPAFDECTCGATRRLHLPSCATADPGPDDRWDEGFLQRGPLYAGGVRRIRQRDRRAGWADVARRASAALRVLRSR